MSTGVPTPSRAVLIAVACSLLAATISLVNVAASLLSFPRVALRAPMPYSTGYGFLTDDALLTMAIAGALAGALGLLVLHRAPDRGWTWLLSAGTVLSATLVLPLLPEGGSRNFLDSTWFRAAIGAGPVLVLLGLLGAASWLMYASATGTGAAVAGLALVAPIPGVLVLSLMLTSEPSFSVLRAVNVTLALIGIAGAIGAAILVRSSFCPVPRVSTKVTVLGVVAAALPVAPAIVERIGRQRFWSSTQTNPLGPSASDLDQWVVAMGLCGLAMFAVAVGLAAPLGTKALGATLAAGLVLYGVDLPVLGRVGVRSSAGVLVLLGLGLAIGIAGALGPWRTWVAGATCVVTGIAVLVTFTEARPSEAVGAGLLLFGVVAAVTTFAAAAEAVAEGTPAMLGTVAVAIQLGLTLSGTLLQHNAFLGSENTFRPLAVAAGIALLVGALLVVAVRLTRVPVRPADQATVSPELPVAR